MSRAAQTIRVLALVIVVIAGPVVAQRSLARGTPAPATPGSRDPATGEPVVYLGPDGVERGRLTVVRVTDPVEAAEVSATPVPGVRLVAVEIVVENTGAAPLTIAPFDVLLQDDRGFLSAQLPQPFAGAGPVTGPGARRVLPGERVTGRVIFQVPAAAGLTHLFYAPEPGRLVTLADLRLPPATSALRPTA
ncbi:MAG: hypothetical protein C4346_05800 [Chloroflexota bacterium]